MQYHGKESENNELDKRQEATLGKIGIGDCGGGDMPSLRNSYQ